MDEPNTPEPTEHEREGERWPGDTGEGEPSYSGVWRDLTPAQQSAYMHARRRWKDAQQGEGESPGKGKGKGGRRDDSTGSDAASPPQTPRERLAYEMENATLPADRIRAASELGRLERAELEQQSDEVALWVARRNALQELPPATRLDWLLGEMRAESEGAAQEGEDDEGSWALPPE